MKLKWFKRLGNAYESDRFNMWLMPIYEDTDLFALHIEQGVGAEQAKAMAEHLVKNFPEIFKEN